MKRTSSRILSIVVAGAGVLSAVDAHAFRMIQNSSIGRTSTGTRVLCDDPGGFAHWTTSSLSYRLNTSSQGSKAGVVTALQNAMASWTNVSPAGYTLSYAGTTTGGFATDGTNAIGWGTGNGCTGGCLAITALVLLAGQVIIEADISFNDAVTWNTNGSDYDVEAIAAHELGHTLGIHHTEVTRKHDRPTMYTSYFGTDGRTLETDDKDALNCSWSRYPAGAASRITSVPNSAAQPAHSVGLALESGPRPSGAILRFALARREHVRLEVFDVAGRHVATLMDEDRDSGEHEVAWDGGTSTGHVVTGVFFARATTPDGTANATMILAP